jgi:hypothetical protein
MISKSYDDIDDLIATIASLLKKNIAIENIHDACIENGWREYDIFLAVKAAELLQAIFNCSRY